MGTPARVVIAAPLPRLPLTAVAPARTRTPNTALVLAAIILDARSVESTSPASIRRSVERSSGRSRGRSIERSRRRALAPSFHRSRLDARGGPRRRRPKGGARSPVPTRRGVCTSDFYPPGRDAYMCGTHPYSHPHRAHLSGRSIAFGSIRTRSVSRRLGRFFARRDVRTRWRARGRRETTTGDERRETRDGRRETGDAASSATRARRRRPSRRLDEESRGTRRDDGVGALFPRVGGREGGTRSPVITPRG